MSIFTPEQSRNVDEFLAAAERRKREFVDVYGKHFWYFGATTPIDHAAQPVRYKTKVKTQVEPHVCKIDRYKHTDADGRTWLVEHRH